MKLTIQFFLLLTLSLSMYNGWGQKNKRNKEIIKEPKNHYAQDKETFNEIKLADNKMLQHSYYDAIDLYQSILEKQPDNVYVNHRIAHAYFITRDYNNAEKFYSITITHDQHHYPEDYYYYAETLEMQGKYEEAIQVFQLFSKQKNRTPEVELLRQYVKQKKRSCNYALKVINQDTAFAHVNLLPKEINHSYSDFSPMPVGKDTLIFATRMQDSIIFHEHKDKDFYPVRLYQSVREEGMTWSDPERLEIKKLDQKYAHTANGTYSPNGKRFYFTRCVEDSYHNIFCDIHFTEKKENGTWTKPKKLPKVNKYGYTSTQPTVEHFTKRKRKKVLHYDVIYFSSNRPNGVGGLDIWYSIIDANGKVTEPINCGKKINTPRHEITPYYDNNHRKLFFSSNHHYGLGGYDVQEVKGSQKRWTRPQNAGIPINSSYDDTYYRVEQDTNVIDNLTGGYIVSNRPGGFALKSATCCDDIYHFNYYEPETITVEGLITEKKLTDSSETILLSDVKIGMIRSHYLEDAKLNGGVDYNIISEHITWTDTSNIKGEYHTNIIKERSYSLIVIKEGYITPVIYDLDSLIKVKSEGFLFDIKLEKIITKTVQDSLHLLAGKDHQEIKDSLQLLVNQDALEIQKHNDVQSFHSSIKAEDIQENTKFILKNVYFDTDKSILKKESTPSLRLLLNFMLKHPNVKIEVSGHTDSHGSNAHNKKLSTDRANAVRNYLLDNGIEKRLVIAVGYGEEQFIALNEHKDGTDNPEGRKLNRRTEVKILSKTKDKVEFDHSEMDTLNQEELIH